MRGRSWETSTDYPRVRERERERRLWRRSYARTPTNNYYYDTPNAVHNTTDVTMPRWAKLYYIIVIADEISRILALIGGCVRKCYNHGQ